MASAGAVLEAMALGAALFRERLALVAGSTACGSADDVVARRRDALAGGGVLSSGVVARRRGEVVLTVPAAAVDLTGAEVLGLAAESADPLEVDFTGAGVLGLAEDVDFTGAEVLGLADDVDFTGAEPVARVVAVPGSAETGFLADAVFAAPVEPDDAVLRAAGLVGAAFAVAVFRGVLPAFRGAVAPGAASPSTGGIALMGGL